MQRPLSVTPEVLVVGAGIAGLSLAWHLAADHRVLVVDQGATLAGEATGQSSGMIRRLGEDPIERALGLRTDAWMREAHQDWPGGVARRSGAVLGLVDEPTHLNDGVAHLRARGVEVVDERDVARVAPVLAGVRLSRAWWLPDEQVTDTGPLAEGYARGVLRQGGELRLGVRVTRLRREAGRCVGVDTDAGPIEAGAVALAAGAWCAKLAADAGLVRPLFPLRRPILRARPAPPAGHPWVWLDDRGLWLRPDGDAYMVSACEEVPAFPAPGPGTTGAPTDADRLHLGRKLGALVPALVPDAEAGWTGLRTFAPDRRPVLGADPALPGLWWVAGLGGYGITCAHAASEAVAAWLRGDGVPWLSAAAVSPDRPAFRRWPIRPDGTLAGTRLVSGELPTSLP